MEKIIAQLGEPIFNKKANNIISYTTEDIYNYFYQVCENYDNLNKIYSFHMNKYLESINIKDFLNIFYKLINEIIENTYSLLTSENFVSKHKQFNKKIFKLLNNISNITKLFSDNRYLNKMIDLIIIEKIINNQNLWNELEQKNDYMDLHEISKIYNYFKNKTNVKFNISDKMGNNYNNYIINKIFEDIKQTKEILDTKLFENKTKKINKLIYNSFIISKEKINYLQLFLNMTQNYLLSDNNINYISNFINILNILTETNYEEHNIYRKMLKSINDIENSLYINNKIKDITIQLTSDKYKNLDFSNIPNNIENIKYLILNKNIWNKNNIVHNLPLYLDYHYEIFNTYSEYSKISKDRIYNLDIDKSMVSFEIETENNIIDLELPMSLFIVFKEIYENKEITFENLKIKTKNNILLEEYIIKLLDNNLIKKIENDGVNTYIINYDNLNNI
jgi:hypothetical protein